MPTMLLLHLKRCSSSGTGVVAALMIAACRSDHNTLPSTTSGLTEELNAALTESGRSSLRSDGTFRTNLVDQAAAPQLTEAQANQLAKIFGRAYAVHTKTYLETQHQHQIAFDKLEPCGRSMYASSPYHVASDAPKYLRNLIGPRWFVTLCAGGVPRVSVAVAASAAELRVDGARNRISFPDPHGNEFLAQGIPPGWHGALAASPEQAVVLAHRATRRRVDQAPRLTIVDPGWIPQAAQWVVHLESELRTADAGTIRRVFVGLRLDGTPAVGNAAVLVQIPREAVTAAPNVVGPLNQHLAQVSQNSEFRFGWKTAFRPIR